MAKRQSRKSTAGPKISEQYLRELLAGMGGRFQEPALKRLMTAIREDKPLEPPDAGGWDIGAMLVTASALVTQATALMGEKGRADKRAKPRASRRSTRTVQKRT
jgi:hypothetical protein